MRRAGNNSSLPMVTSPDEPACYPLGLDRWPVQSGLTVQAFRRGSTRRGAVLTLSPFLLIHSVNARRICSETGTPSRTLIRCSASRIFFWVYVPPKVCNDYLRT
jgi:hypothetical protein